MAADDDIQGAITFAAFEPPDGPVLSTATVYEEAPPAGLEPIVTAATTRRPWRLRAVATEPGRRSEGLGRAVLDAVMEHLAAQGDAAVWCYARARARTFYERAGFIGYG